jgi:hypothetical protein
VLRVADDFPGKPIGAARGTLLGVVDELIGNR